MKLGVPADTNPNLEVLLVFLVVQGNVTPAWVFFDQANPPPPPFPVLCTFGMNRMPQALLEQK